MKVNVAEWNALDSREKMQMISDAVVINFMKIKSSNR